MNAAPPAKRVRATRTAHAVRSALSIDQVMRMVLAQLDFATVDALLDVVVTDQHLQHLVHDTALWQALTQQHFHGPRQRLMAPATENNDLLATRSWDWRRQGAACDALKDYLCCGDECEHFNRTMHVVRGNIGDIQEINSQRIDGIAFPTSGALYNPHIGAAAVVFRRAGRDLDDYVNTLANHRSLGVGEVEVTPGFDAGVRRLIHCVGPDVSRRSCLHLLERTYDSLLDAIVRENLTCVAITSISTGNLGVPVDAAAIVAMRTIQRFLRRSRWQGTLGIVCFDAEVFHAFTTQKFEVIRAYNKSLEASFPSLPQSGSTFEDHDDDGDEDDEEDEDGEGDEQDVAEDDDEEPEERERSENE